MATGSEGYASLGATLKEVMADGIAMIIPDQCVLQKLTPFDKDPIMAGLKYVQPTLCRYPDGFSHVPAGTGPSALNPAKAGKVERAEIGSNSIYLVDTVDKDMIDRTKQDNGKYDKPAIKKATAVIFPALIAAAKREDEIVAMYGQVGRGKVSYNGSAWSANVVTVGGVTTIIVDKADWGPGLWVGSEGMDLSFFDDSLTSSAAPVFLGTATLVAVNMDTRTLTLQANITAALTGNTTAGSTFTIWRSSTRKPLSGTAQLSESIGVQGILQNQSVLFNIDASQYNLYRSPQFNVAAAMSINKIMSLSSRASYAGTSNGAVLLVPVDTWTDLATNETTFRRWTDLNGALKIGADALSFYGASGLMAIKAHPMLKRGHAWLLNLNATSETPGGDIKRIGDCEWTYDNTNGDVLHYVPGLSGYEIRLKCNKAVFINPPGRSALAYGITDSQP